MNLSVRHWVFWPPILLIGLSLIYSLWNYRNFIAVTDGLAQWLLGNFGWLFNLTGFAMLILVGAVFLSPLGSVKIGGNEAQPILTKWRWFSITLCTTIASGILFWGAAEPLYHLTAPPKSLGITANSPEAATFAMSSLFMHWTFTPYAIYTIPALGFALGFYNRKLPFSISTAIAPLFGRELSPTSQNLVDSISLFTLVAGMAASLGTGILTICGGIDNIVGWGVSPTLIVSVGVAIVTTFIVSASSGLMKGIRLLSDMNTRIFFCLAFFVLMCGPTQYLLNFGSEALGSYFGTFIERSFFTGASTGDNWPKDWTMFYLAIWFAWAPITALFLGRISVGHSVRQFICVNFFGPACFSIVWMSIFGGTSLKFAMEGLGLVEVLQQGGPESVVYAMFDHLPLSAVITPIFLFTAFVSYVTAADSNTEVMAGLSSTGISPSSPSPSAILKFLWGMIIGSTAITMILHAGVDGVKMLCTIGGFPAMFLIILMGASMVRSILESFEVDPIPVMRQPGLKG